MTVQAIPIRMRALAREVGKLHPDWRNPERYFERRDELERELRQLANAVEQRHG